eukprot:1614824-Rhodomonas_salina.1
MSQWGDSGRKKMQRGRERSPGRRTPALSLSFRLTLAQFQFQTSAGLFSDLRWLDFGLISA